MVQWRQGRATTTLGSDMQITHSHAALSSGGGSAGSASSPHAMPCSHVVKVAKLGRSCGRCAQHARMTPYTASGHPAGWSRRPPPHTCAATTSSPGDALLMRRHGRCGHRELLLQPPQLLPQLRTLGGA